MNEAKSVVVAVEGCDAGDALVAVAIVAVVQKCNSRSQEKKVQAPDQRLKSARAIFALPLVSDDGVIPGLRAWGSAFAIVVLFYRVGVRRGLLKSGSSESKWRIEGGAWWLERCEGLGRAAFHDTEGV